MGVVIKYSKSTDPQGWETLFDIGVWILNEDDVARGDVKIIGTL